MLIFTLYALRVEKKKGGVKKKCVLCSRNQIKKRIMEQKKKGNSGSPVYTRIPEINVDMYTQSELEGYKLLRGRCLLNQKKGELSFVQNEPRGPRSVEIGRTLHSRMVRRPDGEYTITFRTAATERHLKEQMISEVRDVVKAIVGDYDKQLMKAKAKEKEGGEE